MGQETEIGKMVAAKLKDGTKSPSEDSWNRLDLFLEEEKQRKRKNIFYWLIGGGLAFLVGSYILFGTNILSENSPSSQKTILQKEESGFTFDNDRHTKDTKVETIDSIRNYPIGNKQPEQTSSSGDNAEEQNQKNPQQKEQKNISKKEKAKSIDETFKVTENYHYYNSRDG